MPRGRKKTLASRPTTPLILLVTKFFLIKLGSIPILIVNRIFYALLTIKPRRGRPRKTPLHSFYGKKVNKFLYHRIPKSIRVTAVLTTLVLIILGYTFLTFQAAYMLPSPNKLISADRPTTTEFYDRNGKLLYRLYEGRNRSLVNIDELPPYLVAATVSIEDKNFYKHIGFDPVAMTRALYLNIQNGTLDGASTITQQLVKNVLLTPEKTYIRKLREVFLSFWAERLYSKKDIMQMYLNEAPYGGAAWGIEAASQTYFGKSARDLTLAEATYLAGLPASPTKYSPYGPKPELAKLRQTEVLRRMVEDGYITSSEAMQAENEELNLSTPQNNIYAPHFVMYLKELLADKYGLRVVSQGGLKIYTSLDLGLQESIEKIVKDEVSNLVGLNVTNGAAMVTDPKTGQILAMVGSHDYHALGFGNFNVTTSLRQSGSAIKPITYATAFKQGFSPGNTVLDTPVVFKDAWGNSYSPVNYDGTFHGPVSIRRALGSSYNIPAVRTLASVGVDSFIQTARDLGITTFTKPQNYGLSITLGAADVKMIDMMSVYGAFANAGVKRPITGLLKVTDSSDNILEEYQNQTNQAISPQVAYLITSVLSDNEARKAAFGPNSLLNIPPHVVAVKTGTSDGKKDNSTYGYTEDFVVGAWVGNNNNALMSQQLASGVTGAAPIWNKIMKGLLATHPSMGFTRPDGIVEVMVDGRKDLSLAGNLPKSLVKVKTDKDKTTFFDAFSAYATSSATAAVKNGDANY